MRDRSSSSDDPSIFGDCNTKDPSSGGNESQLPQGPDGGGSLDPGSKSRAAAVTAGTLDTRRFPSRD
ncbi:hypothetical protein M6B38_269155 [Iris pallida]|uniref:Uncharacterized protein n=1 Tax=Iris pallida TaxID=29817 RepID=A0AAX6IAE5_IRIPA|nr:hypothetical protein M6B38_269155 [Iris pallida]